MSRPRYRDLEEAVAEPKLLVPDPLKVRLKSGNWDGSGTVTGEDTGATAGYLLDSSTGMAHFENIYGKVAIGLLAYATKTTQQAGITSITDVTGLSVTWTAVANRAYKLTAHIRATQQGGLGSVVTRITQSDNTSIAASLFIQSDGDQYTHSVVAIVEGLTPGSVTYKVRMSTNGPSVNAEGSTTAPAWFMVEDVGPATV